MNQSFYVVDDDYALQERIKHNKKMAREGSWLNDLFEEHNLSSDEKQEVLRSVIAKARKKRIENMVEVK